MKDVSGVDCTARSLRAHRREAIRSAQAAAAVIKTSSNLSESSDVKKTPAIKSRTPVEPAFRFLDLPAEIRNRIYRFSMEEYTFFVDGDIKEPPTTAVSSQLRREALPIFAEKHYQSSLHKPNSSYSPIPHTNITALRSPVNLSAETTGHSKRTAPSNFSQPLVRYLSTQLLELPR